MELDARFQGAHEVEPEIRFSRHDACQYGVCAFVNNTDAHARMSLAKELIAWGSKYSAAERYGSHCHQATAKRSLVAEPKYRVIEDFQCGSHLLKELPANIRRFHTARRPVQQAGAERLSSFSIRRLSAGCEM